MDRRYEVKITQYAEQSMREIAKYIAFDLAAPEAAIKLMLTLQTEIRNIPYCDDMHLFLFSQYTIDDNIVLNE